MGLFDIFRSKPQPKASEPVQMIFRWLPDGQVVWYADGGQSMIDNAYMNNHVVWTVQDWKASKVASAPPLVYKVKDEKAYNKYRYLMKSVDPGKFSQIHGLKKKALEEVEDHKVIDLLNKPNSLMSRYEMFYGLTVYKDIVGSGYLLAVRNGIVSPTEGEITELWLPPAHQMVITSGGVMNPVKEYSLSSNPEKKISAKNVCQVRHFSPDHKNPTAWLYGMSRLQAGKSIIQKYNEGNESETSVFQSKGIRDIIFPKGQYDPGDITTGQGETVRDKFNRQLRESGNGGIMTNNVEIGSIRVGFSPSELGISTSQETTKKDICSMYQLPAEIFNWSPGSSTFNNVSEARKRALTDAVLPELEILKDALTKFIIPSFTKDKDYVIDFDDEYYAELQDDKAEQVKWMSEAPLTPNERREVLGYDARDDDPNGNKIIIPSKYQLLESMGTESFGSNPDAQSMFDQNDDKS